MIQQCFSFFWGDVLNNPIFDAVFFEFKNNLGCAE
jgi:hypothetical protein